MLLVHIFCFLASSSCLKSILSSECISAAVYETACEMGLSLMLPPQVYKYLVHNHPESRTTNKARKKERTKNRHVQNDAQRQAAANATRATASESYPAKRKRSSQAKHQDITQQAEVNQKSEHGNPSRKSARLESVPASESREGNTANAVRHDSARRSNASSALKGRARQTAQPPQRRRKSSLKLMRNLRSEDPASRGHRSNGQGKSWFSCIADFFSGRRS